MSTTDHRPDVTGAPPVPGVTGTSADTRVLVACVGNIFLGDDGFGVEVARHLAREALPDGVRMVDYGTGAVHLAYDLHDGCEALVLVDIAQRGEAPGTVSVVEPDLAGTDLGGDGAEDGAALLDPHSMTPDSALAVVERLPNRPGTVLLVTCEPASTAEGMELSEQVAAAVPATCEAVRQLAAQLAERPADPSGEPAHPVHEEA